MTHTSSYRPARPAKQNQFILSEATWQRLAASLRMSNRELEITKYIFDDRKECAIARELGISSHTVHTHVERLYRKLNVGSRVELVVAVFTAYISMHHNRNHVHDRPTESVGQPV